MFRKGFTLIELIIVIAIIGVLATLVLPRYFDIRDSAEESARDGVVSAVRSGIAIYHGRQLATQATPLWPAALDSTSNGACTACFSNVLEHPINDYRWVKAGNLYTYSSSAASLMTFSYDNTTGEFLPYTAP